ncbi:MAG: glycosyltransferase family 2 protein [Methanophagales archaeon]|nr:glycosyltransferase family 2 protein [Methanophagales archaeon]
MKTIAGIPAHNNWRGIASLIDGADEHVDEIIVVDDGSEDKTVKITERTRTGATVIKQGNAGEGVAIRRLMEEARCGYISNDRGKL